MKRLILHLVIVTVLLAVIGQGQAISEEYIVNGGFEDGYGGWETFVSGDGAWWLNDGNIDPLGPREPLSPISGSYDALALQGDVSNEFLFQTITLPVGITSATLSWSDRILNDALAGDFEPFNQSFVVGIFPESGPGPGSFVFMTLPGDALIQFEPNSRSFDVTDLAQSLEVQQVVVAFMVFSSSGPIIVAVDNVSLDIETGPVVVDVDIDIKPGSYPNSINLGSNGNVPVAILSSADFDATTVDPYTVTLAGALVLIKGKAQTPMASAQDVNGDGLADLVVHVNTQALQLSAGDVIAVLQGQTYDGKSIIGEDTIRIVQ